jgi:lipid-A-disaccharide synthase
MRLFLSAGEPSGDLHGANLVRALQRRLPGVACDGFGGERMAAAGCAVHYPLCELAGIGILGILSALPKVPGVLRLADRLFGERRPDALVLIDFPGFHWQLARVARRHGVPVAFFLPPQLWAWGRGRIRRMRRLVDRALCTLPFEEKWYRENAMPSAYVGHPYFDELSERRLDGAFLAAQRARPGVVVGVLPGSRGQELTRNLDSLLRAARLIHARRPDVRFLAGCLREEHAAAVRERARGLGLPLEAHAGRTTEIIHLSHSCLAKSGSVGLELLYYATPAVVYYRLPWVEATASRWFIKCKYISLVNLLADKLVLPEYLTHACRAEEMAGHVLHWLADRGAYEAVRGELAALRARSAAPGACDRAAAEVLDLAGGAAAARKAG